MKKEDIILSVYPMPSASVNKLAEEMTELSRPKGFRLLEAGRTENNIYFVRRGIVRAFVEHDGKDITFWIGTEGAVVVSLRSYVGCGQGYETIECMEDTDLYTLRWDTLDRLFHEDIHIANWGRKLAEMEFLRTEEKLIPLLFTTGAERYKMLLKNQPELLQRLPLECLATYLGITPVSLSRIRAEIRK